MQRILVVLAFLLAATGVAGADQRFRPVPGAAGKSLSLRVIAYDGSTNGELTVEVKGAGGVAEIRVSDDGIGIPLEAQTRIFERFYRVDRARSRDRGGTGLGLAIVKHVAELHGGTVELHSELGQGSTFTVRIPLLEPAREAAVNGRRPRDKETA